MSVINVMKHMILDNGKDIIQSCFLDLNGLVVSGIESIDFDEPTLVKDEYVEDESGKKYTTLPFAVLMMLNEDSGGAIEDKYGNGVAFYYE